MLCFSIVSLCLESRLWAQRDTLYVNDTHTLTLVFPGEIERAITGHPGFNFGYDGEGEMRMGIVQGHPGRDSNLLVLTRDGLAYSFYLSYRKRLTETHRFIGLGESIGSLKIAKPLDPLGVVDMDQQKEVSLDTALYQKGSAYFLRKLGKRSLKTKRKQGLIFRLRELAYFGTEAYLVMELENRSAIDFEVDFVQVYKQQGNPRRNSSYQKLPFQPLYVYQLPSKVQLGQVSSFVLVMPKFTLGNGEGLILELVEQRGSRTVVLFWN